MANLQKLLQVLVQTYREWKEDHAQRLAAAIAYYTAFSIAPLLVIVIAIAGLVLSSEDVRERILTEVETSAGGQASTLIAGMIDNTAEPGQGIFSTIVGVGSLLLGAIGVFTHLQGALDAIWDVEDVPRQRGIRTLIREKVLSLGFVLILGFLLLVSLVISTFISALGNYAEELAPGMRAVLSALNIVVSFGLITLLFAMLFKFLPHTRVEWQDVWIGAALTALLFTIGRQLLSWYLGTTSTESAYGAAGSLVVVMLWIYYSAQIMLFGAEFTQVYARNFRAHRITPVPAAPVPATDLPTTQSAPVPRASFFSGVVFIIGALLSGLLASRLDRR
jgi:membrane protein